MASSKTAISLGVGGIIAIGLLGGSILKSVLSSNNVPVGSIATVGNIVLLTSNGANSSVNADPSIVIDSGAVVDYKSGAGIPGGGVRISASGSTILRADVLVPARFQSGATLDGLRVECNSVGLSTSGSIVVNRVGTKLAITTGVSLKNGISVSSGAYTYLNSGATINTKLTKSTYLSFVTNPKTGSTNSDCILRPMFHEKYGR
jgi:hypothetical protein